MAIEEKLLRCDFSFSNYDKDLTMTLSLLFLLRASALFIHMKDIFFACIQSSLQSTDFYGLLARRKLFSRILTMTHALNKRCKMSS